MHPDDLLYPAIWFRGIGYFLRRADRHTGSYFGGPFEGDITGVPYGASPLHHIAQIRGAACPPLTLPPLIYGICYDGCEMRYREAKHGEIDILEMEPKRPSIDWPYPNYPPHLPYFPLELEREQTCSLKEFSELSCQPPFDALDREALIVVPPSPVLGFSIWGPSGDMECVQIVFRYDTKTQIISAMNQCA
ncbi:MAG TPA: hypothetical protein VM735_02890 [Candidatus Kapabacteria bacterium]|jgi:hypothetical protein|nr:hypothetical protein [Candidatus Kapabacteria bacterium]